MYLCSPSGNQKQGVTLLLLSLFILHYFSKALKWECGEIIKSFRRTPILFWYDLLMICITNSDNFRYNFKGFRQAA